jgi:UDP-galactopyranose mutase
MKTEILIVGCGLSGAVIAEQLANKYNKKVTIIDKRPHIGGNCYDYIDAQTNIRVNKYGAHLFHTNDEEVWEYINKFSKWIRYDHKVVANIDKRNVSVPVNMETINIICNEHLQTIEQTKEWLEKNQIKFENPKNSEEIALSRVGRQIYEKLFLPYTLKQWNKHPKDLDSSVLSRIPVKYDNDTRYFTDKYQVIPEKGYTSFFESLLSNPNIEVLLNTSFDDINIEYDQLIFTGPIDSYFSDLEKLEYRSIDFNIEVIKNIKYYQPNSVVNYPEKDVPYTRIVEYKHFLNQKSNDTIIVSEKTNDIGEPYYPVPNKKNLDLYEKYKVLAKEEESKNVFFVGRLANYKYFNMDEAISNSLEFFENTIINKFN